MAVTYSTNVKNSRMTAVKDAIDGGAGAGKIELGTAGFSTLLAVIPLNDPCGSVTNGVLTFGTSPALTEDAALAAGVAAVARVRDSNDVDIITGLTVTATGGGGDITLDNTNIALNQQVTISSATITHA